MELVFFFGVMVNGYGSFVFLLDSLKSPNWSSSVKSQSDIKDMRCTSQAFCDWELSAELLMEN